MTTAHRAFLRSLTALAALGCSVAVLAQSDTRKDSSFSPKAGQSFIDIAVGKPQYSTSCGNVAGFTCSNNGTSYSITAGNMFTRNIGAELTWLDFGRANRAGGTVNARGLNMSAVGRMPLGDHFALEGKVGATYGITHVNADPLSGLSSGRDSGVGLGYGVALDVNFERGIHGSLGWEQHDFHFAGQGDSNVSNVTVAVGYTF